ncbi:MAG TPA: zinc ribbon domain-containing protein [Trichocoleus sp.]
MATCPRCQTTIDASALQCPHCRLMLKAHGHPGIPLYRATSGTALCESCTYHQDDTCTFPQRPHAETCTLYRDINTAHSTETITLSSREKMQLWLRRRTGLIALITLLGFSFLLVLMR